MTPVEVVPQHMRALEVANERRLAAVAVKGELRDGACVAAALSDPRAGALTVLAFLAAALRGRHGRLPVAEARAFAVLSDRALWMPGLAPMPSRRVRDLTDRQRAVIVRAVTSPDC